MAELLKGLLSGGWILLAGWYFPSAIVVSLFGFLAFPVAEDLPLFSSMAHLDGSQRALTLVGIALVLALLLNSLQTPLYRMLEGYLWPEWLQTRRIEAQRSAKRKAAVDASPRSGILRMLSLETHYERFPVSDDQIAPTRLGNAIRRLEEYGYERYRLDSQLLWEELWACAPDAVTAEIDRARAKADFFVCLIYLSAAFAGATLCVHGMAHSWGGDVWIQSGVALASCAVWYRLAISMTDSWAYNVKAMVNLGRQTLAAKLGMSLPATIEDERAMWLELRNFVAEPYADRTAENRAAIDRYRR